MHAFVVVVVVDVSFLRYASRSLNSL